MNFSTHHKRLSERLASYSSYLGSEKFNAIDRIKLVKKIVSINNELIEIEDLAKESLNKQVASYQIQINSQL